MGAFSKKIRVRAENGEALAAALRAAGFEARWLGAGTAHTSLNNGCSDENHCNQHPSAYVPQQWGAVETNVGGNKAHSIWLALGLIKE